MKSRLRSLCCVLAVIGTSLATSADPLLREFVDRLGDSGSITVEGEPICNAESLVRFYARRNHSPAWETDTTRALIAEIERAEEDGLQPDRYHLASLRVIQSGRDKIIQQDLLLTDAFFLLSSNLLNGVVDPELLVSTWCLKPRAADLVEALEVALEHRMVAEVLARMRPSHEGYGALKKELLMLRSMMRAGSWPTIPDGPPLRQGDTGERVAILIRRLGSKARYSDTDTSFDGDVDLAVRRFQRLHGIEEDGIVGPETLRELNVPIEDRIRQIELNLERWRWLPSSLGETYLLVNIPEFTLRAFEKGQNVLAMRIIVGTGYRQTPVFSAEMTQIVLSPYWNVPERIAREELWPKIKRDRSYLAREHLEIVPGGRIRQTPGPWNALGYLKFLFPNRYNVYLHDTPARQLFSESRRAFSHGCMRIERPVDLASWLLRDQPEWTRERIESESRAGTEKMLNLRAPIDVHVLYWTAFVSEDGEMHFVPDIYEQDERLSRAMAASQE